MGITVKNLCLLIPLISLNAYKQLNCWFADYAVPPPQERLLIAKAKYRAAVLNCTVPLRRFQYIPYTIVLITLYLL